MSSFKRRDLLKLAGAAAGGFFAERDGHAQGAPLRVAGQDVEIQILPISAHTVRIAVLPVTGGKASTVPNEGALVRDSWGPAAATLTGIAHAQTIKASGLSVKFAPDPITFGIETAAGESVQQIDVNPDTGAVSFLTGDAPLLGLGEGGPQFDRRGSTDMMRSGQGGYRLRTHGGRVPIPWIISTSGWAIFFHLPYGAFDFTGAKSRLDPHNGTAALPLDLFVIASRKPETIMAEYAHLTGHAQMPALWTFGYQQSHRTLASREEILQEAKTFREKKLPCDTMIYLGTGFCPSGWNTANGSFAWNSHVFADPKEIIEQFHADHFKVVPHAVILSRSLRGTVHDGCELSRFDEEEASCYWDAHRKDFAMGVDGWWPDEGDPLDVRSRLVRNRMYWDGPLMDRPNERPFALHRNGYAGMQRYASFLWSGDVYSTWETLKTHVPNAINTALSGIPYWGTDIGGFVPTKEFTAELYLRWFQFGAFNPLFRSHGRAWKLRLPWQWNSGETGPTEINAYNGAALPDPSQLHNPEVEPICRKYLELRYRLLPYLYSAVRECATTGMPIARALWLHYPDDAIAASRGDEYLWGRDILVAPVTEAGATTRGVYLPRGSWFDFWTNNRVEGGREISHPVDLATMPLFVRAGAILPLGPVKQYAEEKMDGPTDLGIYTGADGRFLLYEDDGRSFNYRRGQWMGIQMIWNDGARTLQLSLAPGSSLLGVRHFRAKADGVERAIDFQGRPVTVRF